METTPVRDRGREPEQDPIPDDEGAAEDRRESADAARVSEEHYRVIVEGASDYAILTTDAEGRVTSWSPGAAAIFGWPEHEAVGRMIDFTFTLEDVERGEPERERALARVHASAPDVRWHLRRDGGRVFIDGMVRALRDESDGLRGFLKVGRDLTARRTADEALRTAFANSEQSVASRTSELAEALVERDRLRRELSAAEEEERRRLSRELHDQLGQHLTALALGLTDLRRLLASGDPLEPRITQLEELTHLMTRDTHYLALELRPPELEEGLRGALQTYVERWSARYGVEAEVAFTGAFASRPVPPDIATAVYRIAQEALTNVARHAQARHVTVQLDAVPGLIRLIIEDDGQGFDVHTARGRMDRERRLGLTGMRERASLVGGSLEIESSREQGGTTLFLRVPLQDG